MTGTKELTSSLRAMPAEQRLSVMAFSIVVDRISRLPEGDVCDLFELFKIFRRAETQEDRQAADMAIMEMLEGTPIRVHRMELGAKQPVTTNLKNWIAFVSARIRQLRIDQKLTQQQLADQSGLPQSHISRIENGVHSPSHKTLERIAAALKVPLHKLDPNHGES